MQVMMIHSSRGGSDNCMALTQVLMIRSAVSWEHVAIVREESESFDSA